MSPEMARPKPDPDAVEHARKRVAEGATRAEVVAELAELGVVVSPATVGNWAKSGGVAGAPQRKAPDALLAQLQAKQEARKQVPAAPAPAVDVTDLPATMQTMVKSLLESAHATAAYDQKRSTEMMRLAANIATDLRQLQKQAAEDVDTIKVPRAELEQAYRSLVVRVINPLRAREGLPPIEAG